MHLDLCAVVQGAPIQFALLFRPSIPLLVVRGGDIRGGELLVAIPQLQRHLAVFLAI